MHISPCSQGLEEHSCTAESSLNTYIKEETQAFWKCKIADIAEEEEVEEEEEEEEEEVEEEKEKKEEGI